MLYNNNWTFDRKICCVLQAFLLTFDLRDTRIKIVIAAIGGRILEWVGITVTRRKSGQILKMGFKNLRFWDLRKFLKKISKMIWINQVFLLQILYNFNIVCLATVLGEAKGSCILREEIIQIKNK